MKGGDGEFDLESLRLPDGVRLRKITPRKILKRRGHFVRVPMVWVEKLSGANGQVWHLAMHLLYLHWKNEGAPIKLANGMLGIDGISRWTKYRALEDLELRGLVTAERRHGKSPTVRLNL